MHRPVARALAALASLVSLVSLAGCGGLGGLGDSPATGPVPDRTAEAPAPRVTATTVPAADLQPLVPGRRVTDPAGTPVTVAPVTLRRQGRLAVLELTVRNEDPEEDANLAGLLRGRSTRFDGVALVDPAARRYAVARDAADACLCTSFAGGLTLRPGRTGLVSAWFPAPPDTVKVVTVDVPAVGAFPGVPLGGAAGNGLAAGAAASLR